MVAPLGACSVRPCEERWERQSVVGEHQVLDVRFGRVALEPGGRLCQPRARPFSSVPGGDHEVAGAPGRAKTLGRGPTRPIDRILGKAALTQRSR